ncbi:hypothetical protein LCGC14_1596570 [marine sediment metagenome]|uniref:Uncharacterized protein n=1 Tax=marine sediment metagenome TaxID=412755 RepID=A0A0F9LCQ4_9ZZZZ
MIAIISLIIDGTNEATPYKRIKNNIDPTDIQIPTDIF